MTRDEFIDLLARIDYWGRRSYPASQRTAERMVDALYARGLIEYAEHPTKES